MVYLDESGFSPSLAVTASWSLPGRRKRIPYENPRGRRVNVLAAGAVDGPSPFLVWTTAPRTLKAADMVAFLEDLAEDGVPTTVVLDNGSIHVSKVTQAAREALRQKGLELFYLPADSPELNAIERVFRTIKVHEMPERTYATIKQLTDAVEAAFSRVAARLRPAAGRELRQAA